MYQSPIMLGVRSTTTVDALFDVQLGCTLMLHTKRVLHATGDIHGTYEYGCKVFRKRMECALMMQVAQRLDPELAKNAVKFESDCDGCGNGNDGACEK